MKGRVQYPCLFIFAHVALSMSVVVLYRAFMIHVNIAYFNFTYGFQLLISAIYFKNVKLLKQTEVLEPLPAEVCRQLLLQQMKSEVKSFLCHEILVRSRFDDFVFVEDEDPVGGAGG